MGRCPRWRSFLDNRTGLIGWIFHPDPALFVIPRKNPNFVVALYPVSVLIMAGHPNVLLPFRNPFAMNLPVT